MHMTVIDSPPDLASSLRRVLRHMPAPVGIITSSDADTGDPVGLVMSAIMPVSLDPVAMVVAVNRGGGSHEAIIRSGHYAINLLSPEQARHVEPFMAPDRRADRFRTPGWRRHDRSWIIDGAPANIICTIEQHLSFGTHDLLVGLVRHVIAADETPILGWCNGSLGTHAPLEIDRGQDRGQGAC